MKIGIFGGTFNPIHNGHLINASIIKDDFDLDKILIIPAKIPVHKNISGIVMPEDRCTMVSLAIDGMSGFQLSRIEIDREEPSYTIITIEELKRLYPGDELFLIIGYDSFLEITSWKQYERIIELIKIIVMVRSDDRKEDLIDIKKRKGIYFAKNPQIDISSSCLRKRIKESKSVRHFLPDGVLKYIKEKDLYKS